MKRTKDLGAETIQWPSERYLTIGSDFAGKMWVLQVVLIKLSLRKNKAKMQLGQVSTLKIGDRRAQIGVCWQSDDSEVEIKAQCLRFKEMAI